MYSQKYIVYKTKIFVFKLGSEYFVELHPRGQCESGHREDKFRRVRIVSRSHSLCGAEGETALDEIGSLHKYISHSNIHTD